MPGKRTPTARDLRGRLSLTRQLAIALVPAFVIVAIASWFLYEYLAEARDRSEIAARDTRLIAEHQALINAVLDAETGERGFLLTGKSGFLEPYRDARAEFVSAHDRLERAYPSDSTAAAHLETIRSAFTRWREEVADPLIEARRSLPVGIGRRADSVRDHYVAWMHGRKTGPAGGPPPRLAQIAVRAEWMAESIEGDALRSRWAGIARRLQEAVDRGAGRAGTAYAASPDSVRLLNDLETLTAATVAAEEAISQRVRSEAGKQFIDRIRVLNREMIDGQQAELDEATAAAERIKRTAMWLGAAAPLLAFALGLAALMAIGVDAVRGIRRVIRAADDVATGHLATRVPVVRRDEVGQLATSFNRMAGELEIRRRREALMDRFRDLLSTSETADEALHVCERLGPHIFPGTRGCVYLNAVSKATATPRAAWPDDASSLPVIGSHECRALRKGSLYEAHEAAGDVFCPHLEVARSRHALCVPLIAQDTVLGLLAITFEGEDASEPDDASTDAARTGMDSTTANRIGEQLAVFLANQRLKEQLREESIRDGLTGLFNRRYLDETLARELQRVLREGKPLSVVSLDVDHFKHFNDTYGHEAGDVVLAAVGGVLESCIRGSDIACRAGGEEFVLVLPGATVEVAHNRAEEARCAIAALEMDAAERALPSVTVSLGVATAPGDGDTTQILLRHADEALYRAKRAGRNRVVLSSDVPSGGGDDTQPPEESGEP